MPSNTYPRHRKLDLWRLHVFPKIPLWSVAKRAIHSFRPFMHVPYTLWVWSNFYQIVKTISEHFNTEEVLSNCVSAQPCSNLSTIWTVATRFLCPRNFPGKNIGVGCYHFYSRNFPNSGIEPASLVSPGFAGGFFTTVPLGKPTKQDKWRQILITLCLASVNGH